MNVFASQPAAKQATTKNAYKPEKAEPMDLAAEHRHLLSTANKVFGEGKWSHTVVSQTLDFVEIIGAKCCAGCVSFVKVQLENGNFHQDVGYYSAEESTKGLSIHNARIGSTINALKRVLLSFGDKIERELQQLQKQIQKQSPEQANDVQRSVIQLSDKQIPEKSNVSQSVKVPASCVPQTEHRNEFETNKNSDLITVSTVDNATTEANPLSPAKIESTKIEVKPSLNNKTNSSFEQKSKQALSTKEMLRMERKRRQMEKQMEFKKRMIEKSLISNQSTDDNKPNPRY